jgi:hypothetical protein
VEFLALKKTGFSEKKNSSPKKKKMFYLFSMQLFSADATMFSKIFFFFFFAHKKLKKPPSKVAHNRPKHFIPQPSPSHSQQPKIDFSCHKNVPPSLCLLLCEQITNKCLFSPPLLFSTFLNCEITAEMIENLR